MGRLFVPLAAVLLVFAIAKADEIPFDATPTETPSAPQESAAPPAPSAPSEFDENVNQPTSPPPKTNYLPYKPGKKAPVPPSELSGLGNLAPFSDIAVIHKRFLPKTKRFELYPNFGLILNDAFFTDVVVGGRLAYYLTEKYGVELIGTTISSTNKTVTSELGSERQIKTSALATPVSYFGADFKWVPIYGKIGWMNRRIIPFDFYFSAGAGVTGFTQTNATGATTVSSTTSSVTGHLGGGQIFAISKWMAGRWDISWYAYQGASSGTNGPANGLYTNLHATIGMSFFFPGAEYR